MVAEVTVRFASQIRPATDDMHDLSRVVIADFKVEYSSEAVMQLERLEKATAKRIIKKIGFSQNNPHQVFKGLSGRPEYKLRIGDYRVIADIDDKKQ